MWKNWFTFSRSERYGLVILFVIIALIAIYPSIHQEFFFQRNALPRHTEFEKVDSFFRALKLKPRENKNHFDFADEEKPVKYSSQPFEFDPNTITISQLESLGFSQKQAKVIENYRNRGGKFFTPADFEKIYVVDSSMFERLKNYIKIDSTLFDDSAFEEKELDKPDKDIIVEVNTADTLELVKLNGIGNGYARRIMAYRKLLGGFVNVEQLSEIWGFPPELLESVRKNLTVDSTLVQKININLVSYQDLRKHPYLNEYQAKAIIYFRETKGNYNSIDEVLKNKLVDIKTFNKLKFYLTVN